MSRLATLKTDLSGNVPSAIPEGDLKNDLVVMWDGRQVAGAVLIRARKNASGEIEYPSPLDISIGARPYHL